MKLYKTLFARSWSITRKHPALWLLGAFVLFWGGKGIELEQFFTNADLLRSPLSPLRPTFWEGRQWLVLLDTFAGNWWLVAAFVAVLAVLVLAALVLMIAAQIGLIDAYGQFDHGKDERYTLQHAFHAIKKYLMPVGIVLLLTKGAAYALLALAAIPLFFDSLGVWQFGYALLLFLIVTPMAVVLSAIAKFATNDIVVHDTGWLTALNRGYALLRNNAGVTLEFIVAVYLVYVVISIAVALGVQIITMPLLFGVIADFMKTETLDLFSLYQIVYRILLVLFAFIAAAIFSAWHMGSWVLFYQELSAGRKRSTMHRMWKREKTGRA